MTDDPFESRLDHLFAVVDEPADALAFRAALSVRLSRDRLARRCAMLGAGLLGAGVAAIAALPVLPRLMIGLGGAAQDAPAVFAGLATAAEAAFGVRGIDPGLAGWTGVAVAVLVLAGLVSGLERLVRV
jgi:hypothetical protein